MLLVGLWRFAKRWPWPFVAVVAFPFLFFWIYWGNGSSGFPREGMQAWILAVLAVLAIEQAAERFSWLRSRTIRAILVIRGFEVFAYALGATIGTRNLELISNPYPISDSFALFFTLVFAALMMFVIWWETRPGSMLRPIEADAEPPARR